MCVGDGLVGNKIHAHQRQKYWRMLQVLCALTANLTAKWLLPFSIKLLSFYIVLIQVWYVKPHYACFTLLYLMLGLPQTKLGNFLETRVNEFLKRQPHPESGDVTVRVVHVSDKVVEVKPGMKSRWETMPSFCRGFCHLKLGFWSSSAIINPRF